MAPEHSDGLDDYDVPSRTATAGESNAETLRRVIVYGDTNSALTPDGSMVRLGTVTTPAGRRSSRLASTAATGGGIAAEDPETQAIILSSLQAERTVVERLRAALPPPNDDWSESGGDVEPGAEYEVDYVEPPDQSDDTTAAIDDDSGVVGVTQGAAEGAPTHEALRLTDDDAPRTMPGLLTMCANHERCGRTQAVTMCVNPAYCCDDCAYTNGKEHAEHCYADQTTDSHAPGQPMGLTAERDDAPRIMPGQPTECVDHERCGRALRLQHWGPPVTWVCDVCVSMVARRQAEHGENPIDSHVPGSAEMEATLNDTKPAPMDF